MPAPTKRIHAAATAAHAAARPIDAAFRNIDAAFGTIDAVATRVDPAIAAAHAARSVIATVIFTSDAEPDRAASRTGPHA